MSKNKTLSNLSMAAIALMAAAVPCFAQAQSNFIANPGSGLTLALNRSSIDVAAPPVDVSSVEPKNMSDVAVRSPSNLSPAAFTSSYFTRMENNFGFGSQVKIYDPATFNSKPQFRSDDYTQSKRSRVTFVPSRGPWMMK